MELQTPRLRTLSRCGIDQGVQADSAHPRAAMAADNGPDQAWVQVQLPTGIHQFGQESLFTALGLHTVIVEPTAGFERIEGARQQVCAAMEQGKGNPVEPPTKRRQHLGGIACKEAEGGDAWVGREVAEGVGMGNRVKLDTDYLAGPAVPADDQRQGACARAEHGYRLSRLDLGGNTGAFMG